MLSLLMRFLGFSLISFLCDVHRSLSNFILNLILYFKSFKECEQIISSLPLGACVKRRSKTFLWYC